LKLSVRKANLIKAKIRGMAKEKFDEEFGEYVDLFYIDAIKMQDALIQDIYGQAGKTPPQALLDERSTLIARFQKIKAIRAYADTLIADADAGKLVDPDIDWPV
jgi:hypothetical protein